MERDAGPLVCAALGAARRRIVGRRSEGRRPRHRPGRDGGGRRDRARCRQRRQGAGLYRDEPARARYRRGRHGDRRAGAACRPGRSGRRGRARGDRGRDGPAACERAGIRSRGAAIGNHRGVAAIFPARRGRDRLGRCRRLHGASGRCGERRLVRRGVLVRRRRLRDGGAGSQYRVRRRGDASQHGAGAGRRGIRPRQSPLLRGRTEGLPHRVGRACELLQEQRSPGGPRQLLGGGAGTGRGAPRRQHALSRHALREARLRGVHPARAGVVRVRLQTRTHPAPAGAPAARHRLGQLPRLLRRRNRAHRLRRARPQRVHREPDGRFDGAVGVAARQGRHADLHAREGARLLFGRSP